MLRHGARGEDFVSGHDRGTQGHPWVACRKWLKINVGFAGCGKTRSGAQEASGHDFSRAVSAAESIRASAPAVCFSGISVGFGPFSAACLAPDERFSRILPEIGPFSAACLAPERLSVLSRDKCAVGRSIPEFFQAWRSFRPMGCSRPGAGFGPAPGAHRSG